MGGPTRVLSHVGEKGQTLLWLAHVEKRGENDARCGPQRHEHDLAGMGGWSDSAFAVAFRADANSTFAHAVATGSVRGRTIRRENPINSARP